MVDRTKLIKAHNSARAHLFLLLRDLTESQWKETPPKSKWSIQRNALHILNGERYWMAKKEGTEPVYLTRETTLEEFFSLAPEIAEELQEKVEQEFDKHGLIVIPPDKGDLSYSWILLRSTQHAIYHMGMISGLRHQVSAPKLERTDESWELMADSVFFAFL